MKKPKKEDFNYGDHITDWLYWEQEYNKQLDIYIDYLENILKTKRDVFDFSGMTATEIIEMQEELRKKIKN